ncbi:MAG: SDR family oxidoreductase [Pyrinomonadaceae bacterium]
MGNPTKGSEVVVVTGASAGVGRATVREFARRGAHVALIARGRDGLEAARREVEHLGGRALVLPLDVSDADAVEGAAERVERELGPIDVWVNNAMVSVFSPVREMRPEEYRRVTEVTYLGYVHGTLAALKRMLPRDRGCIVQVGSALAYRGIPLQSAYCAAKHAIQGFMDSLHAELLHEGSNVRVTMVQLPAMNTPQFSWVKSRLPREPQPVPPIYQPEVGARAVYWAAHNERRELYVGWPTIKAVVGDKVAPGFADWYLSKAGYDAQQTDEPVAPDRRDNLWEPVPGDHGARGRFDEQSSESSQQLWATTHRGLFALAGVGALLGAAAAKLLLNARERRFADTQLERFRESGVM